MFTSLRMSIWDLVFADDGDFEAVRAQGQARRVILDALRGKVDEAKKNVSIFEDQIRVFEAIRNKVAQGGADSVRVSIECQETVDALRKRGFVVSSRNPRSGEAWVQFPPKTLDV